MPVGEVERESAGDRVDREPADPGHERVEPAGRMLPRVPKAVRLRTSCASPSRGPQVDRMPWVAPPSALPTTMAAIACQKPRPKKATAMTPTKTVANSRFGADQVASSCQGEPWRLEAGMASMPPGSTKDVLSGGTAGHDGEDTGTARSTPNPLLGRSALRASRAALLPRPIRAQSASDHSGTAQEDAQGRLLHPTPDRPAGPPVPAPPPSGRIGGLRSAPSNLRPPPEPPPLYQAGDPAHQSPPPPPTPHGSLIPT